MKEKKLTRKMNTREDALMVGGNGCPVWPVDIPLGGPFAGLGFFLWLPSYRLSLHITDIDRVTFPKDNLDYCDFSGNYYQELYGEIPI